MTILVIGGVGFLGSHIVEQLIARETSTEGVAVLDLHDPPEKERVAGVKYYTGDIRDEERIIEVLKEVRLPFSAVHAQ